MRSRNLVLCVIPFLFLFHSCTSKVIDIHVQNLNVDEILEGILESQNEIHTIKGIARVVIQNDTESISLNQVTLVKYPDHLRVELRALFGASAGVLLSNSENVVLLFRGKRYEYLDPYQFSLSVLYPEIPYYLQIENLIDLLVGRVPFGLWTDGFEFNIDQDSRYLAFSYFNHLNTVTTLYVDSRNLRITNVKIGLKDGEEITINYNDFEKIDGVEFPRKIKLISSTSTLTITYTDTVKINTEIEDAVFY